ncbi:MAG: GNAT family N-acetyltransferase [Nanoarchaeota archaeon]
MITVRPLQERDIIKAGNVVKRAQRITLKNYYPPEIIEEFCRKNNPTQFRERARERQFFVAEHKDRILGLIAIKKNELRTFYVDPCWQGKGVGRLLFERFCKEARKRGFRKVTVSASQYAHPIYAHFGFRKICTKRKTTENGYIFEDHWMEMEL